MVRQAKSSRTERVKRILLNSLATIVRPAVARGLAVLVAAALASGAEAYETNKWNNASGGNWGAASNWSLGRIPTYDDWVELPSLNGDYTINVDGDYQVRSVRLEADGVQTVKLTGTGSVTSGAVGSSANDCCGMYFPGREVCCPSSTSSAFGPRRAPSFSSWWQMPDILTDSMRPLAM